MAMSWGRSNAETLKDINLDAFIQGIKEGSNGQKATLTDESSKSARKLQTTKLKRNNYKTLKALRSKC